MRSIAEFLGIDGGDQMLIERVVSQAGFDFMKANADKFNELPLQRVCDALAGIEAEAKQTIANGRSGQGLSTLSEHPVAALDRRWRETIEARFGYADYESMRNAESVLIESGIRP